MSKMTNEELFALTLIVAILIIAAACEGGCALVERTNQQAIKHGLVQKPSGAGWFWGKPEDK